MTNEQYTFYIKTALKDEPIFLSMRLLIHFKVSWATYIFGWSCSQCTLAIVDGNWQANSKGT